MCKKLQYTQDEPMIISNKYKLIKQIGRGNFGKIYLGENLITGEEVAIKEEPLINGTNLLKNETKIYNYLNTFSKKSKEDGIPCVKWFGIDSEKTNYYMVMDLLGSSLQSLMDARGSFSLGTTLQIGIQLVKRLKFLHEHGLIHRDVKPDNFLIGSGKNSKTIYMIDFGFCKKYNEIDIDSNSKREQRQSIIGTPNYVSIRVHQMLEPGRKDDLESVIYMLIYFYFGKLPWDLPGIKNEEVLKMKRDLFDCLLEQEQTQEGGFPIEFINYISLLREQDLAPKYKELIYCLQKNN